MNPTWQRDGISLYLGDCRAVMAGMEANSIDAVVCDPPYGLEFMGKEWDKLGVDGKRDRSKAVSNSAFEPVCGEGLPAPRIVRSQRRKCNKCGLWSGGTDNMRCQCPSPTWLPNHYGMEIQAWHFAWAVEALRVSKPGAHLVAFGGTRTHHRLMCAIEDAGWEIRDCLMWVYGQGFPKSLDVSKAIDKAAGAKREELPDPEAARRNKVPRAIHPGAEREGRNTTALVTAPATEAARQWNGFGTALKPAWEPIILARKPLAGTVVANVLEWGTGCLNIAACRIGSTKQVPGGVSCTDSEVCYGAYGQETGEESGHNPNIGRWPANLVLSHHPECVCRGMKRVKGSNAIRKNGASGFSGGLYEGSELGAGSDAGYADADGLETVEAWDCHPDCLVGMFPKSQVSGTAKLEKLNISKPENASVYGDYAPYASYLPNDSGSAARFFYTSKASRADREEGLDDFPQHDTSLKYSGGDGFAGRTQDENGEWVNTDKASRNKPRNHHPTVKPTDLMRWLCRLVTPPDGLILDPFVGSGSTAKAAMREGFRCIGIDQSEEYLEIARRRIEYEFNRHPLFDAPPSNGHKQASLLEV
jgi:site-specific DNA-methyltransferase (adenine-specific)